jgi:hypothetical protein
MSLTNTSCKVASDLHHCLKAEGRAAKRADGVASKADLMLDERRAELAEGFTEALYGYGTPKEVEAEFYALIGREVLAAAFENEAIFCRRYPELAKFARKWIDTAAEAEAMKDAA